MLIFNLSRPGRSSGTQILRPAPEPASIPAQYLREHAPLLPEVSELDAVRHYTRLSQLNFSIDTHFYPLGSCTMKYNPKVCHALAREPAFAATHPLGLEQGGQGTLTCLYHLQEILAEVTGMKAVSLAPAAGAQGEFAGVAMIRAYHQAQGDHGRLEMLVPDAAHGTNPASAAMAGFRVREIPTDTEGDVDLDALRNAVGPQTAGIMLTNPSTLGVFERQIEAIAQIVHEAGGLLYYDGANLNAILGRARPGDMGFDVIHLNLHKTFSTPHGGGGPGSGPVGVGEKLEPFLPLPYVRREGAHYRWLHESDRPLSIGRLTAFGGNVGVMLRAYVYALLLGGNGLKQVADLATLNSNYLLHRLSAAGFEPAFPMRRAAHEFIISLKQVMKDHRVSAYDFAKRLLDYGLHAPTVYFPKLIAECMLIEPTETESKQSIDRFADAMIAILREAEEEPDKLKSAPHTTPVWRLDEVGAARHLNLIYRKPAG